MLTVSKGLTVRAGEQDPTRLESSGLARSLLTHVAWALRDSARVILVLVASGVYRERGKSQGLGGVAVGVSGI